MEIRQQRRNSGRRRVAFLGLIVLMLGRVDALAQTANAPYHQADMPPARRLRADLTETASPNLRDTSVMHFGNQSDRNLRLFVDNPADHEAPFFFLLQVDVAPHGGGSVTLRHGTYNISANLELVHGELTRLGEDWNDKTVAGANLDVVVKEGVDPNIFFGVLRMETGSNDNKRASSDNVPNASDRVRSAIDRISRGPHQNLPEPRVSRAEPGRRRRVDDQE